MFQIEIEREFNIKKSTYNEDTYTIEFKKPEKDLIKSLIMGRTARGATIPSDHKSITFRAKSVETLKDYKKRINISYMIALNMMKTLTSQLEYMIINLNKSFIKYDEENIIVIDETKFAYLSGEDIVEIEKDKETIIIMSPFIKTEGLAKELLKIKSLPANISYKCVYYSLGYVIINSLFKEEEKEEREGKEENNLQKKMKNIEGTKLYYFLKRSIVEDVEKRCLLYI